MIEPLQPEAKEGEGSWALRDLARGRSYISVAGYAAEGLHGDAFFEQFARFCGATILYLGDQPQIIPSANYIGGHPDRGLTPGRAQTFYADTIGTLRTIAVANLSSLVGLEPDPWPEIIASAISATRRAGLSLIGAHMIMASESGDFGDTFLYPQAAGDQVGLTYRDMITGRLPDIGVGEQDLAREVTGLGLRMQRHIACLMAGMMPSPDAMDSMSAAHFRSRYE